MQHAAQLMNHLRKQAERLAEAAQAVTEDMARYSYEKALRLVPVRTGTLRNSIRCEGNRVLTRCPYARAVETGTVSRPAQPFLLPAADEALFRSRAAEKGKEAVT